MPSFVPRIFLLSVLTLQCTFLLLSFGKYKTLVKMGVEGAGGQGTKGGLRELSDNRIHIIKNICISSGKYGITGYGVSRPGIQK